MACYILLPHIDDEALFFGIPVYGVLVSISPFSDDCSKKLDHFALLINVLVFLNTCLKTWLVKLLQLLSMVWCAICRAESPVQAVSAVAAATFAVSDLIIVINLFYHPLQYSQVKIMLHLDLLYRLFPKELPSLCTMG